MTIELKVLKGVLLLRKTNTYTTKEEQIAELMDSLARGILDEKDIDEWIEFLKEDLVKTPEQREKEFEEWRESVAEYEAEQALWECRSWRHERDEWDDLWDDRARSVGAIRW